MTKQHEAYCLIGWEAERHNVDFLAVLKAIRTIRNDEWSELFDRVESRYSQPFGNQNNG